MFGDFVDVFRPEFVLLFLKLGQLMPPKQKGEKRNEGLVDNRLIYAFTQKFCNFFNFIKNTPKTSSRTIFRLLTPFARFLIE